MKMYQYSFDLSRLLEPSLFCNEKDMLVTKRFWLGRTAVIGVGIVPC